MKLIEYLVTEDWDEVLDIIEQNYLTDNSNVPIFYFIMEDLLNIKQAEESKIEILVEGYFDEDYDLPGVDVIIDLNGDITWAELLASEVNVLISNSYCNTPTKVLAVIIVEIYTQMLVSQGKVLLETCKELTNEILESGLNLEDQLAIMGVLTNEDGR